MHTWVDLVDPSREALLEALPVEVEPAVLETCLAPPSPRARVGITGYGDYVFGLLVAMEPVAEEDRIETIEVAFVAAAEHLVVVRKTSPSGSVWLPERLEGSNGPVGALVHRLVDDVAHSYLDVVDAADAEIDELEDHVDDWPSTQVRRRISQLRHDLIHARSTAGSMRTAVRRIVDRRLDLSDESLFPEQLERRFSETYETLFRVGEELDVARDLLVSARDYHQSLIAESQNDIVKKLTVIASLLLLPTLIVGFYGQNFQEAFGDFYWSIALSIALIVSSTIAQLAIYRWRRWI